MVFDLVFVSVFLAAWGMAGFLPWLVFSVVTRGRAGLAMLPVSILVGVVAGIAGPALGWTDSLGLWASFGLAVIVPAALLLLRRWSQGPMTSLG